MKTPILLVCALAAVLGTSALAEDAATTANTTANKTEKAKHAKVTAEQREAMMNKRLEAIKAKDEALYKELVALREKDPAAFKAKMQELSKQERMARANKANKKQNADK